MSSGNTSHLWVWYPTVNECFQKFEKLWNNGTEEIVLVISTTGMIIVDMANITWHIYVLGLMTS